MPLVHIANSVLAGLAEWGSADIRWFRARRSAGSRGGAMAGRAGCACVGPLPAIRASRLRCASLCGLGRGICSCGSVAVFAISRTLRRCDRCDAGGCKWQQGRGLQLDSRWGFAIAAFWLAASAFRAAELVFHSLRLRKLWRGATPVEMDGSLRSLLAALPARRIEICTTPDLDRPSVIGFFAPRILIPEWLYSRLTPGELEQVVLHEAEHLRRRDDWTNLLQKLSLVLFPLNPALAWMERRLCREREMACDEGVVERTQAPRTYAACLTALAERGLERRELQRREFLRRAQALSLGAFERRPELVSRVDSILRRRKALHPLAAGALVGIVGCGLVIGAVELSRSPQLVAFVAAPKPDTQTAAIARPDAPRIARISDDRMSEPSPTADDAVFHPSGRYRAIETKSSDVPATRRRGM